MSEKKFKSANHISFMVSLEVVEESGLEVSFWEPQKKFKELSTKRFVFAKIKKLALRSTPTVLLQLFLVATRKGRAKIAQKLDLQECLAAS